VKTTYIKLYIICLSVNIICILISPELTIILDLLILFIGFKISLKFIEDYKLWSKMILFGPILIWVLSAGFLLLLCNTINGNQICERNVWITSGFPFYISLVSWGLMSIIRLLSKISDIVK
jgi:hypothetical protein